MSHCFSAAKTCGLKLMSLYNDFHRAETARNPYKDNAACGIFLWKALESPGKMPSLNHCIKKSKLSMSAAARPALLTHRLPHSAKLHPQFCLSEV